MIGFLRHFAMARWRRFADRAALESWQARRLDMFRRRILAPMPIYRPYADAPFASVPIIEKSFVREHFAGLNRLGLDYDTALDLARRGLERHGVTIGMSSGTSGNRGLFMADRSERLKWAAVMLAKALPQGALLHRQRIALFLSANSRLYATMRANGRIAFRFFDLRQDLDGHLDELERYRPTILVAPAHVLGLLARHRLSGRLRIDPVRVFSAAEVLEPGDASDIAAAWGNPIHQIYQCTEGFLGVTCAMGTLHLNEDYVLVEKEWLDRDRRAFNPVITDFSRHTLPLVRYRMNDVLIAAAHPCRCGSPLQAIERIEGRRDDLLSFDDGDGGTVTMFPDHIRGTILDAAPGAKDFDLVQSPQGGLTLALADAPVGQDIEAVAALAAAIARRGGMVPRIDMVPYAGHLDHTVKLRRIRRSHGTMAGSAP